MSLFFGINIALKGMMTQQAALNVTSNNIANANTDGYTRQRVDMVESYSISGLVSNAQLGSGVDIADVTRIRDEFLDYQLRTQTSSLDYDTTLHDTLSNIETIFNETSSDTGLSDQLDSFWNAWQNLSTNPENSPVRTTVMESAITLTDSLHQISSQLSQIKSDTQTQIDQLIENVNSISQGIAKLNDQIVSSQVTGETPNSLLDARDLLLDQLSDLGNITVTKCQDINGDYTGAVNVNLGTISIVDESGAQKVSSSDISTSTVTGGSLGALAHLGGSGDTADTVQYYINKLNTLAEGIAETINTIHATGYDEQNNSGVAFFITSDSSSEFTSANIIVNTDIQNDVSKIAASQGTTDVKSDGGIALQIADLKDTKLSYDSVSQALQTPSTGTTGTITLNEFYTDMVSELGSQVNSAENDVANQQTLVDQINSKKESLSGVSLDEETANEVLYQHAYNACAKVISVIDEMLDTIINMKN